MILARLLSLKLFVHSLAGKFLTGEPTVNGFNGRIHSIILFFLEKCNNSLRFSKGPGKFFSS